MINIKKFKMLNSKIKNYFLDNKLKKCIYYKYEQHI